MASFVFNYHCIKNKDIDPFVATGLVAQGVIEGAKTSPAKSGSKEDKAAQLIQTIAESSISGLGSRLVLGETLAAGKEAQENGGKYILIHPEVQKQLASANLDLFLIYNAILLLELGNKIPEVEFVDVNIDDAIEEWAGKPDEQAPIYVRLILWLNENAEKYGYERYGNSWKLK